MTTVFDQIRGVVRALCLGAALAPVAAAAQAPAGAGLLGAPAAAPAPPNAQATPAAPPGAAAPALSPALALALAPERRTISSGVAALVNDFVISDYDLDQRVALFVATSGVRPTKDTLVQIRAQVLRSLQDEVLELQEAQKHKITVGKAEVDRAIKNIADDNHTTPDEIVGTVRRAGVTQDVFRQQIAAQLTWQKVVAARFGTDILISDQKITEAMDRLKKGADKPQFLVSEIFIAIDRPEDEASIHASVDQIAAQLTRGAPFATVAGQFSQSPSAADGGDIGWVVQGQLAEEIDMALAKLRPGQITPPVRSEGGYYIMSLRERKEPFGTNIEEMMEQMMPQLIFDPARPLPLDRLLIPLPPNPDSTIKQRAMGVAEEIRKQVRSCSDLPSVAQQVTGSVYSRLGQMKGEDLAKDLRDALAMTDPGQMVAPYLSPVGVELIMRCDPPFTRPVAFELPTRQQLENQLFTQQLTILARSYLRDLRRDAVVETR
jgi:peptidyl-prolyl cis-trans isomerase SurA